MPYPASILYPSTGIYPGDPGASDEEFHDIDGGRGRLPAISVEIDFDNNPTSATRTWTDVTDDVRQLFYTRSGRNDDLQSTSTGSLSMLLDNRSGDYSPTNASSPYYPGVKRMRWVRVRAQWDSVVYPRWQGLIETWDESWPSVGKDAVVNVSAADAMKVLNLFRLGGLEYPEQLSSERVADVCADVGLLSNVSTGISTVIESASGSASIETTALSHLQNVEETENGRLFADASSIIVFQDRHWRLINSQTASGVIGDGGGSAYQVAVLADSPALYWRLGETSGTTANDETANNRDGTFVASPTLGTAGALAGDPNTAITLNGSSQWVTSTYAPFAAGSQRTFEGWGYLTNSSTHREMFGSSASTCMLRVQSGGSDMKFWPDSGSTQADWNAAWPGLNQWVHWALTFNETANVAELYINGASKGTRSLTTNWVSNVATFVGGGRPAVASQSWAGRLDEIAIYPSILSAARVLAHYNTSLAAATALEIPYRETALAYDEQNIWNEAVVTTADSVQNKASDFDSQDTYYKRTITRTLLTDDDAEAQSAAEYLVRVYGDPAPKLPALTLMPIKQTSSWPTVLSASNGQRFTFKRRPASGGTITIDGFVEQVSETIVTGTSWDVSLQLSAANDQAFWVLDHSALDTETALAY